MAKPDTATRAAALLVLIGNPKLDPRDALDLAEKAAARLASVSGAAPPPRERVTDETLAQRIVTFLVQSQWYPSVREVLAHTSGDRGRVHRIIKTMIESGDVTVLARGRMRGLKWKDTVK